MRTHLVSLLLLPLVTTGTGCSQDLAWSTVLESIRRDYPTVPQLSTDSLAAWLADSTATPPVLLDVREPDEYAVSHLRGALRVAPDSFSVAQLDSLPRDTPIVAYCSVGYRSAAVVQRLREAGYTRAVNLEGSLFRWANEGRPVYRDGAPVREVHPYNRLWGRLLDESRRARLPDR